MARVEDVAQVVSERIVVGLSSIVGVSIIAYQSSVMLKILSGGGSLEIGGTYSLSAGSSAAFTWGNGYLLGTSEIAEWNSTGMFFLAATGATITVALMRGLGPSS